MAHRGSIPPFCLDTAGDFEPQTAYLSTYTLRLRPVTMAYNADVLFTVHIKFIDSVNPDPRSSGSLYIFSHIRGLPPKEKLKLR